MRIVVQIRVVFLADVSTWPEHLDIAAAALSASQEVAVTKVCSQAAN